MNTKHTPGPWRVKENCMVIESVPTGMRIGEAYDTRESTPRICPSSEEAEVNLCIMAAAPELFSALEALVNFENVDPADENQPAMGVWADAMKAAQKAIQKAKGENR